MSKKPVKLVTQWGGPLPRWLPMFEERIASSKLVDWELLRVPSMDAWNARAAKALGCPCRKPSFFSMSDLNPMLGHVLAPVFAGHQWWGIINLDVLVGDLDACLTPLLDCRDMVVLSSAVATSGTFMLWRNTDAVNSLYKVNDTWRVVCGESVYFNYDEDNHSGTRPDALLDDSYHRQVKRAIEHGGLRVHYEERQWCEGRDMDTHGQPWSQDTATPRRHFRLVDGKLVDEWTLEEVVMLHFGSKVWPLRPDGQPRYGHEPDCRDYFDREGVYKLWAHRHPSVAERPNVRRK